MVHLYVAQVLHGVEMDNSDFFDDVFDMYGCFLRVLFFFCDVFLVQYFLDRSAPLLNLLQEARMYQHSKEENLLEMQWHLLLLPEKKKKKRSPAESNRLQFCFESRCKTTMTTRVRNAKHEKYIRSGKREGGKKMRPQRRARRNE